ncbi:hypothetical protein GTO89_01695 [Heliobacterium gestii]|uniref:Uncharacterized protein n=1 Tax=Heliomicrobium gestii TaxID=2699 RepID=A0A845LDX3_HELGE|nr:hypothetical protein [Heliomicrobium gestii]MBM7865491.1 hypothetical protein [Heliomicrobium gestii]MZP41743.1 hypothetical protein [Heliomicrobium gestii]
MTQAIVNLFPAPEVDPLLMCVHQPHECVHCGGCGFSMLEQEESTEMH